MAFDLTGRVALVTGVSRGLGWSAARALAEAGATVMLNARGEAALAEKAAELEAAGHRARVLAFDATEVGAPADGAAHILAAHGRLDMLVNNAGIIHREALPEHTDDDFRRVVELDLVACFALAREALRPMTTAG